MICTECRERQAYVKDLCHRCYNRAWARAHTERQRERLIEYRKRVRMQVLQIIALKKGTKIQCSRCGITDVRVLTINHISGIARDDVYFKGKRKYKYPYGFYLSIIKGKRPVDDLDIRCMNCNIIYEYEIGRRK